MGNTIGPSDIITMAPWGAGFGEEPNPIDDDAPSSNAEIISVNNNVRIVNFHGTGAPNNTRA